MIDSTVLRHCSSAVVQWPSKIYFNLFGQLGAYNTSYNGGD